MVKITRDTVSLYPVDSLIDRSSTIAAGGVAQTLCPAVTPPAVRRALVIQNLSSGDLWINPFGTASAQQPSLKITSGAYYEFPSGMVPDGAVSIWGTTTASGFTAWES